MKHSIDFEWDPFPVVHDELYINVFRNNLFDTKITHQSFENSIKINNILEGEVVYLTIYPVNGGSIYNNLRLQTNKKLIAIDDSNYINSITINNATFKPSDNAISYQTLSQKNILKIHCSNKRISGECSIFDKDNCLLEMKEIHNSSICINNNYKQRELRLDIKLSSSQQLIDLYFPAPQIKFVSLNKQSIDQNYIHFSIEPTYIRKPNYLDVELMDMKNNKIVRSFKTHNTNRFPLSYPKNSKCRLILKPFDFIGFDENFILEKELTH